METSICSDFLVKIDLIAFTFSTISLLFAKLRAKEKGDSLLEISVISDDWQEGLVYFSYSPLSLVVK